MATTIDELKKVRLEKLQKLSQMKIAGFPPWAGKRDLISKAREVKIDSRIMVSGRLTALRGHGGLLFADLTDESGKLQLSFKKDKIGEKFEILSLLDIGDFLLVEGQIYKTQSGELTAEVLNFELLTKSLRPLPSSWYGFSDVEERYRQRYVDLLMNPQVRQVFEIRSKVVKLLRKKLDDAGFMEVETPVLQPLYGGATAKPFITHHNSLNKDFYLRVSDELYLKRLIVGGFEKVYELSKDFRNEGMDRQHNPEFTMCEFYWAYANYHDLMEFSEKIISEIIFEIKGSYKLTFQGKEFDFTPPWPRVTYRDLILKDTGIDIDIINNEADLLKEIKKKNIKLDMDGVVGFSMLLDTFYKEVSRPNVVGPMFLMDYPAEMKPLAKRKADEPDKSGSFQLLVNGFELINAYNELNDPIDQRARWEEEMALAKRGLKEYQVLDEDYIRALEYGMPPTAGWGFGIDRFVAFIADQHTLKDTILFPTMKPEDDQNKTIKTNESNKSSNLDDDVVATGESVLKITRDQAIELLHSKMQNQNLRRHCYSVEAVMRALARELSVRNKTKYDQDKWGILGLLHDGDYEMTKEDASKHTVVMMDWLKELGEHDHHLHRAFKSHNHVNTQNEPPETVMEWALACCDELTGFIVAVALVKPDKKLASVDVESIVKKFGQKEFAKAVNRDDIKRCEEKLGIPLNEFVQISLDAMKEIAPQIGL